MSYIFQNAQVSRLESLTIRQTVAHLGLWAGLMGNQNLTIAAIIQRQGGLITQRRHGHPAPGNRQPSFPGWCHARVLSVLGKSKKIETLGAAPGCGGGTAK